MLTKTLTISEQPLEVQLKTYCSANSLRVSLTRLMTVVWQ